MKLFYMMIPFIFLFLSVFLFSCSGKQMTEIKDLCGYDSISVSIDYPILPKYIKLIPYCIDNSVYATGYNYYEHSIDFINLNGGDSFIVQLQREGPNGVLPVQDYCFADDKIVCKDESGILTLSMDGNVINRLPIKELIAPAEKYSVRPRGFSLSNYQYLNSLGDKVFIPLSPITESDSAHIGKIYDVSLHLLEPLYPCYPFQTVELAQYLGSLSIPDINMHSTDKIVYNFPYSSQVYFYDMKTTRTKVLNVLSQTINNEVDFEEWKRLDVVAKGKKELYISRFSRIYYNSSQKKYYRIHYGTKEEERGALRKVYLMSFDENGNSVKEHLLSSQFSEQYFYLHDTLYIACKSSNDNSFNIAKISLENLN